ncbi:hypothetical protein SSS_00028 [Sarcoptes scabiei]|nr:hypothetical protein SSS_00028 [Sarcoptes scabiei]
MAKNYNEFFMISIFFIGLLPTFIQNEIRDFEEECEQEEPFIELCARDFLIFRNESLPENELEMNEFCRINKEKERCLSDHSSKCLSNSANQAIVELIKIISARNQIICTNKHRRYLHMRANKCLNQQRKQRPNKCFDQFVQRIHGIHQFSQVEKIPIISIIMNFSAVFRIK